MLLLRLYGIKTSHNHLGHEKQSTPLESGVYLGSQNNVWTQNPAGEWRTHNFTLVPSTACGPSPTPWFLLLAALLWPQLSGKLFSFLPKATRHLAMKDWTKLRNEGCSKTLVDKANEDREDLVWGDPGPLHQVGQGLHKVPTDAALIITAHYWSRSLHQHTAKQVTAGQASCSWVSY